MLVVLAFRKVFFSKFASDLKALHSQLLFLKQRYPFVLPGDTWSARKVSIMLTFDFASVDFYEHVFPFLCAQQIPAVVGVAWRYVAPEGAERLPLSLRTSSSETLAFQDEIFTGQAPFCTRQELRIMASSPYIQLASSGFAVRNLKNNPPYLATEVFLSKHCIEAALGYRPKAFFYPFGKYDMHCARYVRKEYEYSFVLGNTLNMAYKQHEIYRLEMLSNEFPAFAMNQGIKYLKSWLKDRINFLKSIPHGKP